jgi:hypothetical protein
MSQATTVDMAKVTQMLDAGWRVLIYKGPMGSYEVRARHPKPEIMARTRARLEAGMAKNKAFLRETDMTAAEAVELKDFDGDTLMTDEFTPEQALTRMAYKVHGEIL